MRNRKMVGWLGVGAATGVLMAWGGATTGWTKDYDPAVMAYWVQAIGSIGAVCAAIAVSSLQRRNDQMRERERDYAVRMQTLDGIVALLEEAFRVIDEAPKSTSNDDDVEDYFLGGSYTSEFDHIYQALDRMPLHTIPWWQISRAALELQTALRECKPKLVKLNAEFYRRLSVSPEGYWRRYLKPIDESGDLASAAIEVVRSMQQAIRRQPSFDSI